MVNVSEEKEITAQITITATYDDLIRIDIHDKTSSANFLHLEMTREQFINATMNRLGNTDIKHATIRDFNIVGKKMEMKTLEFEIPEKSYYKNDRIVSQLAKENCPDGWIPDLYFSSQNSFFQDNEGKWYARTIIRRWV